MTTENAGTPMTDAARISAWGESGIDGSIGFTAVPTSFARQLERELAAKTREVEEREAMVQSYYKGMVNWTAHANEQQKRAEQAVRGLAEFKSQHETYQILTATRFRKTLDELAEARAIEGQLRSEIKDTDAQLAKAKAEAEHFVKRTADEQLRADKLDLKVAGLKSEANRLREDAERYRWLRRNRLSGTSGLLFSQAMGWKPQYVSEDQVDQGIDAARAQGDEPG